MLQKADDDETVYDDVPDAAPCLSSSILSRGSSQKEITLNRNITCPPSLDRLGFSPSCNTTHKNRRVVARGYDGLPQQGPQFRGSAPPPASERLAGGCLRVAVFGRVQDIP